MIHPLRKRWGIPTAEINGTGANPRRWPDGSYSVRGAAGALGMTAQTVFEWLGEGRLSGHQLAGGAPRRITLADEHIPRLRSQVRRTSPSRREAS